PGAAKVSATRSAIRRATASWVVIRATVPSAKFSMLPLVTGCYTQQDALSTNATIVLAVFAWVTDVRMRGCRGVLTGSKFVPTCQGRRREQSDHAIRYTPLSTRHERRHFRLFKRLLC